MKKFESSIHTIPFPQASVYAKLSDLTHFEEFRESYNTPEAQERVKNCFSADQQAQIQKMMGMVDTMKFSTDAITIPNTPMGTVELQIIEREEPKCIKVETVNSPIKANLWVQLLPTTSYECKIKVTIGAELNFLMEQMAKKPLAEAVERIAEMLSRIPYGF